MRKNIVIMTLLFISVALCVLFLYYYNITQCVVSGTEELFKVSSCITVSEEKGVYIVQDIRAFIKQMENKGFEFIDQLGGSIIFEKDKKQKDYDVKSRFEYFLIKDTTPQEQEEQYK